MRTKMRAEALKQKTDCLRPKKELPDFERLLVVHSTIVPLLPLQTGVQLAISRTLCSPFAASAFEPSLAASTPSAAVRNGSHRFLPPDLRLRDPNLVVLVAVNVHHNLEGAPIGCWSFRASFPSPSPPFSKLRASGGGRSRARRRSH